MCASRSHCSAAGLAILTLAMLGVSSSRAELLPIINPGFEELNIVLRPGEQTSGAGGVPAGSGLSTMPVSTRWQFPFQPGANTSQSGAIVPGWRTVSPSTGSLAGVLNPAVSFGGIPWMAGYSGNHIITAQAAIAQQTLNVQLQPATTYTLSFLFGIGRTDSSYSPLIQLLAAPDLVTFASFSTPGVEFLARSNAGEIQPAQFGTMIPLSFSYTSPAVLPPSLAGKYLAIAFLGSDGIPRTNYDDFRLEAVPAPGTGAACGAMIALAVVRRRRVD